MPTDLPAGPELDALVAEKVMGWTYSRSHWKDFPDCWRLSNGERTVNIPWCPSTDSAAAMHVVDKIRALGFVVHLMFYQETVRSSAFTQFGEARHMQEADTLPLSICRLALAVVEAT